MSELDRESNLAKEGMRDLKNKVEEEKKKQMRKWVVTFIVQHFVTIAIVFGAVIGCLLIIFAIGDVLGLLDGNGNTAYADDDFSNFSNINSETIGYEFTKSWENYAVWAYINDKSSYNSYVEKYITEDKKSYKCYTDINSTRNFGFGVCHRTNETTVNHKDKYKEQGIDITQYMELGCTLDVEIVDNVGYSYWKTKRDEVEAYAESIGVELESYQLDVLTDIRYQGFGSGYKKICDAYKQEGEANDIVRASCKAFTKNEYNNQARGDARWQLFSEGIYETSGGDILDPNEYAYDSSGLLSVARQLWIKICTSGKYTKYGGASIPVDGPTIDCSSYVSWVLYEYGYDKFKGGQHNTSSFKNTNWNKLYGWDEIYTDSNENVISMLQPGDIFVRVEGNVHHVTLVVEVKDGKVYSYDCGNTKAKWNGTDGSPFDTTWFFTGKYKALAGKIIRVTSPQNS